MGFVFLSSEKESGDGEISWFPAMVPMHAKSGEKESGEFNQRVGSPDPNPDLTMCKI